MKSVLRLCASIAAMTLLIAVPLNARTPRVWDVGPDFEVTTLDGTKITSQELKGNVILLNFWATWCVPCRAELPLIDTFALRLKKNGLSVLAVTTEDSVPIKRLRPLASLVSFPMVRKFKGRYGVLEGVPTNYIIDRRGVVRYAKAGAFDLDELNKLIIPLLNEPVPPLGHEVRLVTGIFQ
jgi:cytochrome c biogenesis protein CcmG, thiol:disulfide interchange protein DsbE